MSEQRRANAVPMTYEGDSARAAVVERLERAIAARDWGTAGTLVDRLRFGFGWNYARMAQQFGGTERWEEICGEIDRVESDMDPDEFSDSAEG